MPLPEPAARPVIGTAWGAVAPEGADTALGLAVRLGGYCWAEQQVYALLGSWVQTIPEADVKLMVAEHADHAAWRAQRWYELLPTAPPGPDALVAGPPDVLAALGRIDEASASGPGDGAPGTVGRLAAAYRALLPHLGAAMAAHLDWSSRLTEPAVGRVLRLCLADLCADWMAGERMLQALATEPTAIGRAHSVAGWLEERIAAAGGLLGPGTTGGRASGGAT